jgi:hypothetical protein
MKNKIMINTIAARVKNLFPVGNILIIIRSPPMKPKAMSMGKICGGRVGVRQQTGPVYLVKAMNKIVPTITAVPSNVFLLFAGLCRMIAQVITVRLIDAKGNQKSRLRIEVDDCIQKIATRLLPRRIHHRHLFGVNQQTDSENVLQIKICVRFIYVGRDGCEPLGIGVKNPGRSTEESHLLSG